MIDFRRLDPAHREEYDRYLLHGGVGCEYSFVNLSIWGRQRAAFVEGFLVLFSQFDRKAVYPFPLGQGPVRPVLDAIMRDACQRDIPCCITGLDEEKCQLLEALYPGKFRFYLDRDSFDYVYHIHDLADLKGRKFQKKRNHLNKFYEKYPDARVEEWSPAALAQVRQIAEQWQEQRERSAPQEDFHLEELALHRALANHQKLGLEGLVLYVQEQAVAFTMGSRLRPDTFDIHFEKAVLEDAYPAINQAFARYLREKYPEVRYLNREDDMGLEGLRKAKLSYNPAFLTEKYWARLWEDLDEC